MSEDIAPKSTSARQGKPLPDQPLSEPWSAIITLPRPFYTPADFQAIAAALGVSRIQLWTILVSPTGKNLRRDRTSVDILPLETALEYEARNYLTYLHAIDQKPRHASIRKALTTLRKDAQRIVLTQDAFQRNFHHLDDASRDVVFQTHRSQKDLMLWDDVEALTMSWLVQRTTLLAWITLLDNALASLGRGQSGRPPEPALHIFIRRLLPLYEGATGRPCGLSSQTDSGGPLFRFVRACVAPLTPHWRKEHHAETLFDHLRAIVRTSKKRRLSPPTH